MPDLIGIYRKAKIEVKKQNSESAFVTSNDNMTKWSDFFPDSSQEQVKHPANGVPYPENGNLSEQINANAINKKVSEFNEGRKKFREEHPVLGSGMVDSLKYGFIEGVGIDSLFSLIGGKEGAEAYQKRKMADITGDENGVLNGAEAVSGVLGNFGGNAAAYFLGTKALNGLAKVAGATKAAGALKGTKAVQALSDSKAGNVLKNPYVRNILAGQAADTLIQTPRVIIDGKADGKSAGEIAKDVAKQQATDLAMNVGFEALGYAVPKAVKEIQNATERAKVKKAGDAVTKDSLRGIFQDIPGRDAKNAILPDGSFSSDELETIRKIQLIADSSGRDFSEIAGAAYQNKKLSGIRKQLEAFSNQIKMLDVPGYIHRIDIDADGTIRIDRSKPQTVTMDLKDLEELRKFPNKKSVFYFDDAELGKTKKWAEKFWNDLGKKSPYYRATQGEWRANSKEQVAFTDVVYDKNYDVKQVKRGTYVNRDTGWQITVGSDGIGDTVSYARGKRYSVSSLDKIDELIEKAVLLDTEISLKNTANKSPNTAFMHKLYAPVRIDGKVQVVKITVEESVQAGGKDTYKKFYNLKNIEIPSENSGSFVLKDYATRLIPDGTTISIADLYGIVKETDKDFYANSGKLIKEGIKNNNFEGKSSSVDNLFTDGSLKGMRDSEIEAVIREEGLPFSDAKEVREAYDFIEKIGKDSTGKNFLADVLPKPKQDTKKVLSKLWGKFQDNFIDKFSIIKKFDRIDSSSSTDALLTRYIQCSTTADYIKHQGLCDLDGKTIGKSLDDIFAGISKEKRTEFDTYLFHKYNFERWENGVPLEVNVTQGDSLKIFRKLEEQHPEFKSVSEELYRFNRELNQIYGVDAGILDGAHFKAMNEVYPSYVPTFREFGGEFETFDVKKPKQSVRKVFQQAQIRHEKVYDVKKLMENKIDAMVHAAHRNNVYVNMIEKIYRNPTKFAGIGRIKEITKEMDAVKLEDDLPVDDLLSRLKLIYSNELNGEYVLSAYKDGKIIEISVDKRLFDAFSYVSSGGNQALKHGTQKVVDFFGKHITGNFKKLVTVYNPLYAISNIFRDFPTAYMGTQGTFTEYSKAILEAMQGISKKDETFRQFCALGGGDTALLNRYFSLDGLYRKIPDGIRKINGFTEMVPRYAEFLLSLKHGDDVTKALYNAANITVDFSRGGRLTKNIDKMLVPYLNARFQGLWNVIRVTRKNPGKTAVRGGLYLSAPAIALYLVNMDNPHYDDLTERQKNYYINFPNLLGDYDENGYPTTFFKVPKSEQFAFLFQTMVEKTLRAACDDKEAYADIWGDLGDGLMPVNTRNLIDNFYTPAKRVLYDNILKGETDIRDFANRPIIPEEVRDKPVIEQYNADTSEIGIWLGKALGVSPAVMDYFLKSYSGVLGDTVLPFTKKNVENPVLQPWENRFMVDSLYKNDVQTTFFPLWDKIQQIKDSAKKKGDFRKYYEYQGYSNAIWKEYQDCKAIQRQIDLLVAGGHSKNSQDVRRLRNKYLEKIKILNQKYQKYAEGE